MTLRFSKLPTWWIRQGLLKTAFQGGGETGTSIAALKCVMAISTVINFYSRRGKISFTDLEGVTGLSRPMVQRGIKALEESNVLRVERRHANEYELTVAAEDEYWAKLPVARLTKELRGIPNRGIIPLTALKIYLLLLNHRKNESLQISTPYEVFCNDLGVRRSHVRPALDILYSHALLHVTKSDERENRANTYTVLGLETSTRHETATA